MTDSVESRVALRAYFKWLDAGRAEGRDLEHWYEAEHEEADDRQRARRPLGREEAIADLQLLVEKAEKLDKSSFVKYLRDGGQLGFALDTAGAVRNGPPEESIDAFLFTLRFFVQDNERTSFRNIEGLFETLPLDARRLQAVRETRATINGHLDSPSNYNVYGQRLIRRHIFEVFLWGDLAHANRAKRAIFQKWANNPTLLVILSSEFTALLTELFNVVGWFRSACQEALDILEGRTLDASPVPEATE